MPRPAARLSVTSLEDRVTPAGGLDSSFGNGGRVTAPLADFDSQPVLIARPDGKLVVVDVAGPNGTRVTEFAADGSIDTTFGTDGTATDLVPGKAVALGEAVAGLDGKLYLAGFTYNGIEPSDRVVVRLNADGTPDAAFGVNGVVTLGAAANQYEYPELVPQADGTLVVLTRQQQPAGTATAPGRTGSLTAVRLTAAGENDPTYGTPGTPAYEFADVLSGFAVADGFSLTHLVDAAPAADGGIYVLAGSEHRGADYLFSSVLLKLTASGSIDTSFGDGGVVQLGAESGGGLAVQPDGRVLVSTTADVPSSPAKAVLVNRYNADGTADETFGDGGHATALTDASYAGAFDSLALLPDGRVVVASSSSVARDARVAVLLPDGRPDDYFPDPSGVGGLGYNGWDRAINNVAGVQVSGDRVVILSNLFRYTERVFELVALTEGNAAIDPLASPGVPDGGVLYDTPLPALPTSYGDPVFVPAADPGLSPGDSAPGLPPALTTPPEFSPVPGSNPVPPRIRIAGDVDGDGVADRAVTDGPRVSVVSGADGRVLVPAFAPFEASYTGDLNAVFVDVNDDGRSELVVSPRDGGGPVVAVYNPDGTERGRFFGIEDPDFRGGVNLALAYATPDAVKDLIVTAGAGGGPRVAIFEGATLGLNPRKVVADFFAFEPGVQNVAVKVVGDAFDSPETIAFASGPDGGPRVRTVNAAVLGAAGDFGSLDNLPAGTLGADRFVGDPADRGGVTFGARPIKEGVADLGDELTARAGDGEPVAVATFGGFKGQYFRPPYTGPDAV